MMALSGGTSALPAPRKQHLEANGFTYTHLGFNHSAPGIQKVVHSTSTSGSSSWGEQPGSESPKGLHLLCYHLQGVWRKQFKC